jgi:hypothetical protein
MRLVHLGAMVLLLLGTALPSDAASSPAQKCGFAKMKAALKKSEALNACYRAAFAEGQTTLDPACVDGVDMKFQEKFQKIEGKGGCRTTNDAAGIENIVDRCGAQIAISLSPECLPQGTACGNGEIVPCCNRCVIIIGQASGTCN